MAKPRRLVTGFCQANNHRLCPELMQAHRTTPKGKVLREIRCDCGCHSEKQPGCRPKWREQLLPLSDT